MNKNIYAKVFGYLCLGLLISFISGYVLSLNQNIILTVASSSLFWLLIILELGTVLLFTVLIKKMNKLLTIFCYFLYSFLTGFTISLIFIAYSFSSILLVFLITGVLFGIFALIGIFTNADLSKLGIYLLIALIGIIIVSIINIFLLNRTIDIIINIIGIVVFVLFIAYDINKVLPYAINTYGEDKGIVYTAFELYLDFINLFMELINFFGKRRDN